VITEARDYMEGEKKEKERRKITQNKMPHRKHFR